MGRPVAVGGLFESNEAVFGEDGGAHRAGVDGEEAHAALMGFAGAGGKQGSVEAAGTVLGQGCAAKDAGKRRAFVVDDPGGGNELTRHHGTIEAEQVRAGAMQVQQVGAQPVARGAVDGFFHAHNGLDGIFPLQAAHFGRERRGGEDGGGLEKVEQHERGRLADGEAAGGKALAQVSRAVVIIDLPGEGQV